jgi:hypothetical protein
MVNGRSGSVKGSGEKKSTAAPSGPFPSPTPITLRLGLLEALPELQCRKDGLDPKHVENIRHLIRDGVTEKLLIKARRVEIDGQFRFFITDGFHTREAWNLEEADVVPVLVHDGTWEDARLDATAANKGQDQCTKYRTQPDVREAIRRTLLVRPNWTDRRVGKWVGCDHKTVKRERQTREASGEIPQMDRREDSTGTMRPARAPRPAKASAGAEPEQPTSTTRARDLAEWTEPAPPNGIDVTTDLDTSAVKDKAGGWSLQPVKEAVEDGERWLKRIKKDVLESIHRDAFRAECEKLAISADWVEDFVPDGLRGDKAVLLAKFTEVERILQALRNTFESGGGLGRVKP